MPDADSIHPAPDFPHNAPVLGRLGTFETRLLRSPEELAEVLRLRHRIFFGDGDMEKTINPHQTDQDRFDRFCDHLLVLEEKSKNIVGTCRLLLQERARAADGFYSQTEFNLNPILKANRDLHFLELGRSCILPDFRSKRTVELLWHGIWSYALQNGCDVLFGCASFPGTDPEQFASAFAWLAENASLPDHEQCLAYGDDRVVLTDIKTPIDNRTEILRSLPPLLKGYLRLGAKISNQAAIDHAFGTTDVLVVLKVADINPRYIGHYGANASRFAA